MSDRQQNLFGPDPNAEAWDRDDQADSPVAVIVLSEPPFGPFDYLVPDELRGKVVAGCRVRVPLGRGNRSVVGYCVDVASRQGAAAGERPRRLKPIRNLLDNRPLLSQAMLRLTGWMSDYYLCHLGQVLDAVVPTGVREQAGTRQVTYLSVPDDVAARLSELDLPAAQRAALQTLTAAACPLTSSQLAERAGCSAGPIRALQKKGLIAARVVRELQSAHDVAPQRAAAPLVPNADQQQALNVVLAALRGSRHDTVLLHGVTGSGKTEVYMRAIDEVIAFGRQAIVLVPEISLTPQTVSRFRARFPRVAVLHSHLSASERHWHWRQIAEGDVQVVVGARSAVFAPTRHLGLIVLDEEHDASFKQDSLPRYHARDVALQRARLENVPVVLGSATPSLESWRAAQAGTFRLVELSRRVLDRPLPDVGVIDLRTEYQNPFSRGAISRPMQQAIRQALAGGGQVILLLNRRGFSTSIQCPSCGHVVRCRNCDIALTHHRAGERAVCHYCDYEVKTPQACPECSFEGIRYSGLGTQKLEAEVLRRFPDHRCLRMDSDTMRKPGSHEAAFSQFRAGEVHILLGTQMIAKGLDFPNVTLVGVINADTALHFPDFRAAERTFQLVTQVAGRSGRGPRGGRVLVQTFSPEHPAIQAAMGHDYHAFARTELPAREEHGYPPFAHMTRLIVRGEGEEATEQFAETLSDRLRAAAPAVPPPDPLDGSPAMRTDAAATEVRILGPAPAPIGKLHGKFRFHTLLIGPDSEQLGRVVKSATADLPSPDEIQWAVDVDPVNML